MKQSVSDHKLYNLYSRVFFVASGLSAKLLAYKPRTSFVNFTARTTKELAAVSVVG